MVIKHRLKSESGFSLVELLIVVCLIGILAAIATPGLRDWKQTADLNADMRRLYGGFQKARLEAVRNNTNCNVAVTATTFRSFIGATTIDSFNYTAGNTGTVYNAFFDRRGLVSAAGTITVQAPNGSVHQLVLNTRGRMLIR